MHKGTCKSCGAKGANIVAQGVCSRCYHKSRRQAKTVKIPTTTDTGDARKDAQRSFFRSLTSSIQAITSKTESMESPAIWATHRLSIPPSDSARGDGKIHWDISPDSIELLEYLRHPGVRQISIEAAAQTGKSVLLLCATAYLSQVQSSSLLYCLPSQKLEKEIPITRMEPMLTASGINFSKKDGKYFFEAGNSLKFALLTSRKSLVSATAKIVIADEITELSDLGFNWESELKQRQKIFENRGAITIYASTPKNRDKDIDLHYKRSRMHLIEWTCKDCGQGFSTEIEDIKSKDPAISDPDVIMKDKLGCVACPHCGLIHDDGDQIQLIKGQKWKCINPEKSFRHLGFRKKSWESVFRSFSSILAEKLETENDPILSRQFLCNECAAPPDQFEEKEKVALAIGCYKRAEPPLGAIGWMMGIDAQLTELWVTCIAIYPDRIRQFWSQRIDRQKGDTATLIRGINHIIKDRPWSGSIGYLGLAIDAGFTTSEIKMIAAKIPGSIAIKGDGRASGQPSKLSSDGLHLLNSSYWQDTVQSMLDSGKIEFPTDRFDWDIAHIENEVRRTVINKKTGQPQQIWALRHEHAPNHLRDCLIYAIYLASTKRLLNLRPSSQPTQSTQTKQQAQDRVSIPGGKPLAKIPLRGIGQRSRW